MKISKSKQELARIISENGGWRGAANIALFGKVSGRCYMLKTDGRPEYDITIKGFYINARDVVSDFHASPFTNWHQTILSREEYFHLYPAPDADGWIEWEGGECPVGDDSIVDVMFCNGRVGIGLSPLPAGGAGMEGWRLINGRSDIIAYRLHNPEQAKPEFCKSVVRSIPEPEINSKNIDITQVDDINVVESKPTIEQLAAEYRNKLDYANRKQGEADKANMESDAALSQLEDAIAAIGFVITPLAATEKGPELVITDWRDLWLGDIIELTAGERYLKTECTMVHVPGFGLRAKSADDTEALWRDLNWYQKSEWRFIRRP